jgi:hypothetical protein
MNSESNKNFKPRILLTYINIISGQPLAKLKQFPKNHISYFPVEFPPNFLLNTYVKILLGAPQYSKVSMLSVPYLIVPLCVSGLSVGFYYTWHKEGFTIKLLTVVLHYNAESFLLFTLIVGATGRT